MLSVELRGKTLGVIGLGRISVRVAEIGIAFGMRVIYYSCAKRGSWEGLVEYRDLETLLWGASIVIIHVPLTRETYHLINEEKLRIMKRNAILINTSRGAVIDTLTNLFSTL